MRDRLSSGVVLDLDKWLGMALVMVKQHNRKWRKSMRRKGSGNHGMLLRRKIGPPAYGWDSLKQIEIELGRRPLLTSPEEHQLSANNLVEGVVHWVTFPFAFAFTVTFIFASLVSLYLPYFCP
jgi:hypothetical protein